MPRVLIIEDDAESRRALAGLFTREEWKVLQANDGDAGLELALRNRPELANPNIVMVKIDDVSIQEIADAGYGRFPWKRDLYGFLLAYWRQPELTAAEDFPAAPSSPSERDWEALQQRLRESVYALEWAVRAFPAEKLQERVPNRDHNFALEVESLPDHLLYHAGQIALLKKARA